LDVLILKYEKLFNDYLDENLNFNDPKNLYGPIKYFMRIGGKRVRPVLLMMTCDLLRKNINKALPAAICVEFLHNFTLVHDDIIDRSKLRRGKQTIHEKWDLNTAILSGDLMNILSYQFLQPYSDKLFKKLSILLNETSVKLCVGQQWDIDYSQIEKTTRSNYIEMIRYKTSELIACSLKMGALIGGLSNRYSDLFYEYGINLGIAFQIQDDYLDIFGRKNIFGKKIGTDILENKKTLLYINTYESSSVNDKKELIKLYSSTNNIDSKTKIKRVKEIFLKNGADKKVLKDIMKYQKKCYELINNFPIEDIKKKLYKNLTDKILFREK